MPAPRRGWIASVTGPTTPRHIWVMKCMDGRINIPIATQTPKGIIQPFRNLGGMFRLGWPHLGETLVNDMAAVINPGGRRWSWSRTTIPKATSGAAVPGSITAPRMPWPTPLKSGPRWGCCSVPSTTRCIRWCGFETDEEALVIHGRHLGATLSMADLSEVDLDSLPQRLMALLPDMPTQMRHDLLPLLAGNLRHIARLRQMVRTLDIEHREWMLCGGAGLTGCMCPTSPSSSALTAPIWLTPSARRRASSAPTCGQAAFRTTGSLVMSSVPYEDIGVDRSRALLVQLHGRLCR